MQTLRLGGLRAGLAFFWSGPILASRLVLSLNLPHIGNGLVKTGLVDAAFNPLSRLVSPILMETDMRGLLVWDSSWTFPSQRGFPSLLQCDVVFSAVIS